MNEELKKQFAVAYKRYNDIYEYEASIQYIQDQMVKWYDHYDHTKKKEKGIGGVIAVSIVVSVLLYHIASIGGLLLCGIIKMLLYSTGLILIGRIVGLLGYAGFIIWFPICGVMAVMICKLYQKKIEPQNEEIRKENQVLFDEKYEEKIDLCFNKIEQLKENCNKFEEATKCYLDFLPEKYRDVTAVYWMKEFVDNGRADTVKEVINLYEEQLHRWELENATRLAAEQAAVTRQMLEGRLAEISSNQASINRKLQNIEALEWYNTFS